MTCGFQSWLWHIFKWQYMWVSTFLKFPPLLTDDSMTILMAFQTQELHIIGLTTVFGNVSAEDATRNALLLVCIWFSPLIAIFFYDCITPVFLLIGSHCF